MGCLPIHPCNTVKGYELHASIIRIALAREESLIEGVDPHDLEAGIRAMRVMMKNVRNM